MVLGHCIVGKSLIDGSDGTWPLYHQKIPKIPFVIVTTGPSLIGCFQHQPTQGGEFSLLYTLNKKKNYFLGKRKVGSGVKIVGAIETKLLKF